MDNETRYFIPGKDGLIDVPEEIYLAFQSAERKTKYLVEQDQAHGVSYYGFLDVEEIANREELKGGILISAEDEVIRKEMYDQLHRCIESLPRAERELINAIFFERKSEEKYAEEVGLTQSGISRQLKKTLSKLKTYMNYIGSFGFFVILFL